MVKLGNQVWHSNQTGKFHFWISCSIITFWGKKKKKERWLMIDYKQFIFQFLAWTRPIVSTKLLLVYAVGFKENLLHGFFYRFLGLHGYYVIRQLGLSSSTMSEKIFILRFLVWWFLALKVLIMGKKLCKLWCWYLEYKLEFSCKV